MAARSFTIGYPIPLDVAGPLVHAIGSLWPDSTVDSGIAGMTFSIPDRAPKRVSKKSLREVLPEQLDPDVDPDAVLEQWMDGTFTIGMDAFTEAQQRLAAWALIMLTSIEAPNYIEQEVVAEEPDGTPRRFHFSVAWSAEQSPHARLKAAEAELERLRAIVEAA